MPDPTIDPISIDDTIALQQIAPGDARLPTHKAYWNAIGPYGGWGAAAAMRAILDDPRSDGVPIAGTFHFMGPMAEGQLTVRSAPIRVNRSTSFWESRLIQQGEDGADDPVVHAAVTLAKRRDTFAFREIAMPDVPVPEDVPPIPLLPTMPAFTGNYEHRYIKGRMFGGSDSTHSQVWYRCRAGSPLTYTSLAAFCDISFPRLFFRLTEPTPISTITMTVQIHADPEDLAAIGDDFVLVESQGRLGQRGYFDQFGSVWSRSGALLATTDQMVWYRYTG